MAVKNPSKTINKGKIKCGETFDLKLALTGVPNIVENPVDIILILDHSTSMSANNKFENMKQGAKAFIDIITSATGGSMGNMIGNSTRIGIVSYGDDAKLNYPTSTNVKELKKAIDAITIAGKTNHAAGFREGLNVFTSTSPNDPILVMVTDSSLSTGENPLPVVKEAKDQGVEIYCIGVDNSKSALDKWASTPIDKYVAFNSDPNKFVELFEKVAIDIADVGATKLKIEEKLDPNFEIDTINKPNFGVATQISNTEVNWEIPKLGEIKEEEAILILSVRYIGKENKKLQVNKSINYTDAEGNLLNFFNPIIEAECEEIMPNITEKCPVPVDFKIDGCQDSITLDMGAVELQTLGRIVQVNATLKNICPNKRLAVAVQLTEVDSSGTEHSRGLKTFLVPAQAGIGCSDITLRCIKFVLPEELDTTGNTNALCNARNFKARVIANYVDTDFACCDEKIL